MSAWALRLATVLALAGSVAGAQAQTVWRCGPDGRSYTDRPCNDGRSVQVADVRPEADVMAAQETAARERRLADGLRLERLRREAQVSQAGAAGMPMPPRPVFKPLVPVTPPKKKRRHPPARLAGADTFQEAGAASRPSRD